MMIAEIGRIILGYLPSFMKKTFHLLMKKRIDKWLESKVLIKEGKVEDVYLPGKLGSINSQFRSITIKKDYDNRLHENLKIKKIFLRVYVNGVPFKTITWEKAEYYYNNLKIKEVETYIQGFTLQSNTTGLIRINIFIPPYVPCDDTIYIGLYGYIQLKSSFGYFEKEIGDHIGVPKEKWIKT